VAKTITFDGIREVFFPLVGWSKLKMEPFLRLLMFTRGKKYFTLIGVGRLKLFLIWQIIFQSLP